MKALIKNNIETHLTSASEGRVIDLSKELLSLADYDWLARIIRQSPFLEVVKLPIISSKDAYQALMLLNEATINHSTLIEMDISFERLGVEVPEAILLAQAHIQSRLNRNKQGVFGIHGGGNIGLGLMADIVSNSQTKNQILATTNNLLNTILINSANKLWLQHDTEYKKSSTCVQNVTMISRNSESIKRLYLESSLLALCVTQTMVNSIAKDIAQALIARYDLDGSGLKILVLMNAPHCDEIVKQAITDNLLILLEDQQRVGKILSGVIFIPTVIDRIVSNIEPHRIKEEILIQLTRLKAQHKLPESLVSLDEIFQHENKGILQGLVKQHELQFHLFKAEQSFSMYVPDTFVEYWRFAGMTSTREITKIEEIKNKYINGPHAVLAWIGGLFGYKTIEKALTDPILFKFINQLMDEEISPVLRKLYEGLSVEDLSKLKNLFITRCLNNREDTVLRVGRDPLRKLESGGRVRGIIELAKGDIKTPLLELGVAAAFLYAIKGIDPSNLGCQKIREIHRELGGSFPRLLCYSGPAPSGTFTGFNFHSDEHLISRIVFYMQFIDNWYRNRCEPKLFLMENTFFSRKQPVVYSKPSLTYTIVRDAHAAIFPFTRSHRATILPFTNQRSQFMRNFTDACDNDLGELPLRVCVDKQTGHLSYGDDFQSLALTFELVFVRHGETYGNCGQCTKEGTVDPALVKKGVKNTEKRIFQGCVDTEINQLTALGKLQASDVAKQLKERFLAKGWEPDVVLISPLSRAQDTAKPFIEGNNLEKKCNVILLDMIKEMSFGAWDNRRVCDMPQDHPSHLFYQDQNSLIKESGINGNSSHQEAENFYDVLLRAYRVLMTLNKVCPGKKIVMFSHSMFGAACAILLGQGQKIEHGHFLAFDGKRKNGTSYTLPHATPILLNGEVPLGCESFPKTLCY